MTPNSLTSRNHKSQEKSTPPSVISMTQEYEQKSSAYAKRPNDVVL
jgi:hypothetical protein